MTHPFGVGIVGLQPDRGWAARAHVPALPALPGDFEIVGAANTNKASSRRRRTLSGITNAG